jgi:hypothetical protein
MVFGVENTGLVERGTIGLSGRHRIPSCVC